MNRLSIALLGCAAFVIFCNASGCKSNSSTTEKTSTPAPTAQQTQPATPATPEPAPAPSAPAVNVASAKGPVVKISTPFGDMTVMLYNETPRHRDNFLKLAGEKFYDNLLFHRCINTFMIQGGDPQSRGAAPNANLGGGGPGYTIPAEFTSAFLHKKGALCAARQGDQINPRKESSGSQFYIVQGRVFTDMELNQMETNIAKKNPGFKYTEEQRNAYKTIGGTPMLDMEYTVFGEVIDGLPVIDKIASQKTKPGDRPETDITMKMEIIKAK
jgi:cyclophilin family peptidyl-prolyl cis-trans isomerase